MPPARRPSSSASKSSRSWTASSSIIRLVNHVGFSHETAACSRAYRRRVSPRLVSNAAKQRSKAAQVCLGNMDLQEGQSILKPLRDRHFTWLRRENPSLGEAVIHWLALASIRFSVDPHLCRSAFPRRRFAALLRLVRASERLAYGRPRTSKHAQPRGSAWDWGFSL